MIAQLYTVTQDPRLAYYITEMHKFALDTAQLTDPVLFESYDCIGVFAAFHDTPASVIATYSDFLANVDSDLGQMWMLGFGDVPAKQASTPTSFLE